MAIGDSKLAGYQVPVNLARYLAMANCSSCGSKETRYRIHVLEKGQMKCKEGRQTLFRSNCLTMLYKNFPISWLLGIVDLRSRFARITIGSIGADSKKKRYACKSCRACRKSVWQAQSERSVEKLLR